MSSVHAVVEQETRGRVQAAIDARYVGDPLAVEKLKRAATVQAADRHGVHPDAVTLGPWAEVVDDEDRPMVRLVTFDYTVTRITHAQEGTTA